MQWVEDSYGQKKLTAIVHADENSRCLAQTPMPDACATCCKYISGLLCFHISRLTHFFTVELALAPGVHQVCTPLSGQLASRYWDTYSVWSYIQKWKVWTVQWHEVRLGCHGNPLKYRWSHELASGHTKTFYNLRMLYFLHFHKGRCGSWCS